MYISGLKMKDAQGFCLDDAPPASDEDGVRAVRAKFLCKCCSTLPAFFEAAVMMMVVTAIYQ